MRAQTQPPDDARLTHVFQPIWELATGEAIGFEALARFADGTPPEAVWARAHDNDDWRALDERSLLGALAAGRHLPGRLFVNMSAQHLADPRLIDPRQARAIARLRGSARAVVIEITEDAVDRPALPAAGPSARSRARAAGVAVGVALDDVGSGHSTPERLHLLRPEIVKLDRPVVDAWLRDGTGALAQWVALARAIGAAIVAEGVEDRGAAPALADAGVTHVQGFAFGRPAPARYWTEETLAPLSPSVSRPDGGVRDA